MKEKKKEKRNKQRLKTSSMWAEKSLTMIEWNLQANNAMPEAMSHYAEFINNFPWNLQKTTLKLIEPECAATVASPLSITNYQFTISHSCEMDLLKGREAKATAESLRCTVIN